MPLLDHLVELRRRLVYSFIAVIVLFFICYYFSAAIYARKCAQVRDVFLVWRFRLTDNCDDHYPIGVFTRCRY